MTTRNLGRILKDHHRNLISLTFVVIMNSKSPLGGNSGRLSMTSTTSVDKYSFVANSLAKLMHKPGWITEDPIIMYIRTGEKLSLSSVRSTMFPGWTLTVLLSTGRFASTCFLEIELYAGGNNTKILVYRLEELWDKLFSGTVWGSGEDKIVL